MQKVNQASIEDARLSKAAIRTFLSGSALVYATGFWFALYTESYFLLKLFSVEAIITSVIIYLAIKYL